MKCHRCGKELVFDESIVEDGKRPGEDAWDYARRLDTEFPQERTFRLMYERRETVAFFKATTACDGDEPVMGPIICAACWGTA